MYDNILIDGKNIVFRATMASRSSGYEAHPVTIMIRMMDRWRRIFKPANWHMFWDVPKDTLWRRDIYPEYKEGRPDYDEYLLKLLKDTQRIAAVIFDNMSITQYIRANNEADDLIYAFLLSFRDEKNLVVTSDGDATQIPYHLGVDLYNPSNKDGKLVPVPKYDPIMIKSLAGDKSDNIPNYRLVRDLTAQKIIDKDLDEFLEEKGRELYDRNMKLVDLSANPHLESNIEYIKNISKNDKFNIRNIEKVIAKFGVKGLRSELITKIGPFKNT